MEKGWKHKKAKGGEVGKKGRYHILGEIKGKSPVFYASTNDKNSISKLVEQADKDLYDLTEKKHKIFVTDSLNDEELHNYAKGGGVSTSSKLKYSLYLDRTVGDNVTTYHIADFAAKGDLSIALESLKAAAPKNYMYYTK